MSSIAQSHNFQKKFIFETQAKDSEDKPVGSFSSGGLFYLFPIWEHFWSFGGGSRESPNPSCFCNVSWKFLFQWTGQSIWHAPSFWDAPGEIKPVSLMTAQRTKRQLLSSITCHFLGDVLVMLVVLVKIKKRHNGTDELLHALQKKGCIRCGACPSETHWH